MDCTELCSHRSPRLCGWAAKCFFAKRSHFVVSLCGSTGSGGFAILAGRFEAEFSVETRHFFGETGLNGAKTVLNWHKTHLKGRRTVPNGV